MRGSLVTGVYTTLLSVGILSLYMGCSSGPFYRLGSNVLERTGLEASREVVDPTTAVAEALTPERIAPEEEFYIGRAVAAKLLSLHPMIEDELLIQYVNKVGHAVVALSGAPETFGGYRFVVVEGEAPNAFAAPGGFIFVTRGMLYLLPDEDALAAVLAHEVSHVTEQHALRTLKRPAMTEALSAAGIVAGALTCNQAIAEAAVVLSAAVDQIVGTLLTKGFSREQEFQADREALRLLTLTTYDTQALFDSLGELENIQGKSSGGWFATHPAPKDRTIALLRQRVSSPPSTSISRQASTRELREKRFLRALGQ